MSQMGANADNTKPDVVVVGAGPTGLTLACELLRRGVSCRVIEKRDSATSDSRAMGVQRRTLEIFGAMDVIEAVAPELSAEAAKPDSVPARTLGTTFLKGERTVLNWWNAGTPQKSGGSGFSGVWLPQADLEKALQDHFEELGGSVELNSELKELREEGDDVVAVAGNDAEYRAPWLVGCDGSRSATRKLLNLPFRGASHPTALLLADVELSWDPSVPPPWEKRSDRALNIFLSADGPFLIMPLPRRLGWRLIAIVRLPNKEAAPPEPTLELMGRLLTERTGLAGVRIDSAHWSSAFRLSERIVPTYRVGNSFLAGDAAHIHSPIGGQGMNTGVQDSYNLAWKLAAVIHGDAEPRLLDTYEEERYPVARRVLKMTRLLTLPFEPGPSVITIPRTYLLAAVFRLRAARAQTQLQLSQLKINYRKSSLSHSSGRFSRQAPRPGDRAPDAKCLEHSTMRPTNVFEITRGTGWTLLVFHADRDEVSAEARLIGEALQKYRIDVSIRLITRTALHAPPDHANATVLVDAEGEMHNVYGASKPRMFLIRPDGYVGFRTEGIEAADLTSYLEQRVGIRRRGSGLTEAMSGNGSTSTPVDAKEPEAEHTV